MRHVRHVGGIAVVIIGKINDIASHDHQDLVSVGIVSVNIRHPTSSNGLSIPHIIISIIIGSIWPHGLGQSIQSVSS